MFDFILLSVVFLFCSPVTSIMDHPNGKGLMPDSQILESKRPSKIPKLIICGSLNNLSIETSFLQNLRSFKTNRSYGIQKCSFMPLITNRNQQLPW